MKKDKKENNTKHKNIDAGQIFVKVMAGILALLMIGATASTCIFTLMNI